MQKERMKRLKRELLMKLEEKRMKRLKQEHYSRMKEGERGCTTTVERLATEDLEAMIVDNWKLRSIGMRCTTCMFFVEKLTTAIQAEDNLIGRCRRRAPTVNGFPVVYSSDWCGEHKTDETKL